MLNAPVGIIVQHIPWALISQDIAGVIAIPQHDIIGIPAQVIMQAIPLSTMVFSMVDMSFSISMVTPSPGIIMHIMPLSDMVQLIRQFIGIIIAIGMTGVGI